MIEKYLRQFTSVRTRIISISLILLLFYLSSVPLFLANRNFLFDRFQEITGVEVQVDRLLLKASASASVSRANLIHYLHGFFTDVEAPLEDAARATEFLEEIQSSPIDSERKDVIEGLLADIATYQSLIREIDANRQSGAGQNAQLEVQTLQLGSDIGVRIDQMAQQSELRIAEQYDVVSEIARNRLIGVFVFFFFLLLLSAVLIRGIRHSITKPIAELQEAAEQFRRGRWETTVPVSGNDELTVLTSTFNQMATDLAESRIYLEQRVAQRTQSLETSAEVSHNLSSILDQDAFSIAVVEQLQSTFGYYYVQLYLANDTNDIFTLKSATGLPGQKMLIRGHRLNKGQGVVGRSAAYQDVVVAPDVSQNPHWLSNPLLPETKSEVAVPIISRDVVLGVLDIQHNIVNGINEEEVILLKSISDQIAIALENARLFEKIQQQASHEAVLNQVTQKIQLASSVDQVLQITAQELGKVLKADFTSVQLGKRNRSTNGHEELT
jgi:GAF domain-containing protein